MAKINQLDWKIGQLWNGCILVSVAHAIMVAHYPDLSYEHMWDGYSYCVCDDDANRGTVTFNKGICVAAFRNFSCDRYENNPKGFKSLTEFYKNISPEFVQLSEKETLQYLLVDFDDETVPSISTAFWGKDDKLFSADTISDFIEYSAGLMKIHVMDIDSALAELIERYEMEPKQVQLLLQIYNRKINNPLIPIVLSEKEIDMIGSDDQEGLGESLISFKELNIEWENNA